jgi:transposase InsO family protein
MTDATERQKEADHGIQVGMNGVGSWYDNAPMESFFATLKCERVHHRIDQTREEARTDLFFFIEAYHNRRRLHSALVYLSPEAFEQAYHRRRRAMP